MMPRRGRLYFALINIILLGTARVGVLAFGGEDQEPPYLKDLKDKVMRFENLKEPEQFGVIRGLRGTIEYGLSWDDVEDFVAIAKLLESSKKCPTMAAFDGVRGLGWPGAKILGFNKHKDKPLDIICSACGPAMTNWTKAICAASKAKTYEDLKIIREKYNENEYDEKAKTYKKPSSSRKSQINSTKEQPEVYGDQELKLLASRSGFGPLALRLLQSREKWKENRNYPKCEEPWHYGMIPIEVSSLGNFAELAKKGLNMLIKEAIEWGSIEDIVDIAKTLKDTGECSKLALYGEKVDLSLLFFNHTPELNEHIDKPLAMMCSACEPAKSNWSKAICALSKTSEPKDILRIVTKYLNGDFEKEDDTFGKKTLRGKSQEHSRAQTRLWKGQDPGTAKKTIGFGNIEKRTSSKELEREGKGSSKKSSSNRKSQHRSIIGRSSSEKGCETSSKRERCSGLKLGEKILQLKNSTSDETSFDLLFQICKNAGCLRSRERESISGTLKEFIEKGIHMDVVGNVLSAAEDTCSILASKEAESGLGIPPKDKILGFNFSKTSPLSKICLACSSVNNSWSKIICDLSNATTALRLNTIFKKHGLGFPDDDTDSKEPLDEKITNLPSMDRYELRDTLEYIAQEKDTLSSEHKRKITEKLRNMINNQIHTKTITMSIRDFDMCKILGKGEKHFDLGLPFAGREGVVKRLRSWFKTRKNPRELRKLVAYSHLCQACRGSVESPWVEKVCRVADELPGKMKAN